MALDGTKVQANASKHNQTAPDQLQGGKIATLQAVFRKLLGLQRSEDPDGIGGGRVVGVKEEDGVLIALEAGNVVVESHKGAAEAGDLEGADAVGGPGGGEDGGELEGIKTCGGAAGSGEIGVVGEATDLKFVAGLEVGDGVVCGSSG